LRNIFFTKDFNETINEDVNVILSPQFYWIKKVEIPVKSLNEAKKIAPSLLKLNPSEFYFGAFEQNGEIYVIAIKKDLDLKIDKKYIKSIRIAQCELNDFECLNLPNKFSIRKIDGIFFCFPGHKEDCICIGNVLEKLSLSKYEFNYFNTINLSKTQMFLLFGSFIIFIFSFLIKGIIYHQQIHKIHKKYENLKTYNLPLNSYQLDSLKINLENKIRYNKKIREILKTIQKIPLNENEYIKKISLHNKKISLVIHSKRNFDKYLKKLKFKSVKYRNNYKAVINVE
jgi:hypothetical protein